MVTEVVVLSRKLAVKNEPFTAFSVATPVYSTRYVRLAPLLKEGGDQEICREVEVLSTTVTSTGTDGAVEVMQRVHVYVVLSTVHCIPLLVYVQYTYTRQH